MKWTILAALIFMTACDKKIISAESITKDSENTETQEPDDPQDQPPPPKDQGPKPQPKKPEDTKAPLDILDKNPPQKLLSSLPSEQELDKFKQGWQIKKSFNQAENENKILARAIKNVDGVEKKIFVTLGDIFNEKVEAIVNAANGSLEGGGGIDGMIHDRALVGGKDLMRKEAIAYKKLHNIGSFPNGWAMATNSYGIKQFKLVIFTVGPRGESTPQKELELFSAVYNSMKKASEFGVSSIAATAISTGIFNFPKDIASRLFIKAALAFFAQNPGSSIETIYFTNFDSPTANAVLKGFNEVFELVH